MITVIGTPILIVGTKDNTDVKDVRKCIVNTGAVRWFDKPECFTKMMHPDFKQIEEVL